MIGERQQSKKRKRQVICVKALEKLSSFGLFRNTTVVCHLMSKAVLLFATALLFLTSYGQRKNQNKMQPEKTDASLLRFSKDTGIEIFAINILKQETKSEPEHLKTYFSITVFPDEGVEMQDVSNGEKVVLLPGVCFSVNSEAEGYQIIQKVRPQIEKKGYRLFITSGNTRKDKDKLAIIRCTDELTPLVYMQTNGINYGIETPELVSRLDSLTKELDLKLIMADFDRCEFEIRKPPKDWASFAETIYKLCPDIVEQGVGDVKALEKELMENKRLYFWWD